jgi:DNA-binding LacI/PurR family transcriptional regulator
MGYRPSLLARSLINKRSKIIGVLVPDRRTAYESLSLERSVRRIQVGSTREWSVIPP